MTLRLPLSRTGHATSKCLCTHNYQPRWGQRQVLWRSGFSDFWYTLDRQTHPATPRTDKLILLGDFNARVGTDHQTWEGVIGTEQIGKCNNNSLLLLKKCAEQELLITSTVFRLPTRNKMSWIHPRSKHWHLIDYVIVRRKDTQDVRVTEIMCGAHCWTNHRLVVSKLNLRIQPARRPQGKKVPETGCLQADTRQQEASLHQW